MEARVTSGASPSVSCVEFCVERPSGLVVLKVFYLFWFTHASSSPPLPPMHHPSRVDRHGYWPNSDASWVLNWAKWFGYPCTRNNRGCCNSATSPTPAPPRPLQSPDHYWMTTILHQERTLVPRQVEGRAPWAVMGQWRDQDWTGSPSVTFHSHTSWHTISKKDHRENNAGI